MRALVEAEDVEPDRGGSVGLGELFDRQHGGAAEASAAFRLVDEDVVDVCGTAALRMRSDPQRADRAPAIQNDQQTMSGGPHPLRKKSGHLLLGPGQRGLHGDRGCPRHIGGVACALPGEELRELVVGHRAQRGSHAGQATRQGGPPCDGDRRACGGIRLGGDLLGLEQRLGSGRARRGERTVLRMVGPDPGRRRRRGCD